MRRLAWTFAARIGDKYQIGFTRSTFFVFDFITTRVRSPTSRFSYLPVSVLKGATPHRNFAKADLCFCGNTLLQYYFTVYSDLNNLYVHNLFRPYPRRPDLSVLNTFQSEMCFSIRRAIISAARFLADILTDTSSYSKRSLECNLCLP